MVEISIKPMNKCSYRDDRGCFLALSCGSYRLTYWNILVFIIEIMASHDNDLPTVFVPEIIF